MEYIKITIISPSCLVIRDAYMKRKGYEFTTFPFILGPDLWLNETTCISTRDHDDNRTRPGFDEIPATEEEIKLFKRYKALDKI